MTNLQVMFPFVVSVEEVQKAKRIASEVGDAIDAIRTAVHEKEKELSKHQPV